MSDCQCCADLKVLLEEAASRRTANEALVVIATCLSALREDHPQLDKAASDLNRIIANRPVSNASSGKSIFR